MESRTMLQSFHAQYPGASSRILAPSGTKSDGSYQRLARAVSQGPVLDLGCGDGYLSEILHDRGMEIVGLDMSPHEVALARDRLGPGVAVHVGMAESLPFPENAFAAVVSHMALMLMNPIQVVVEEVRRVLRPGGVLLATIGRWQRASEGERRVLSKMFELLDSAGVDPRLGSTKCSTTAGMESLFAGPGWGDVQFDSFELSFAVRADGLEQWLSLALYPLHMLPARSRLDFAAWLAAEKSRLAPDGAMNWRLAARQYRVPRL